MSGLFGEKLLFFDTETTGVNPENGVWSMSGIYEHKGKIVDAFHQELAPFEDDVIDPVALEMSGRSLEMLQSYKPPRDALNGLLSFMGKHVNKFDKEDKFTMVAYNAEFDDRMLRAWFKKLGESYYGSWFHGYRICVYNRVLWLAGQGLIKLPKYKQDIVCEHFGIKYDAHKSDEDVKACRKLYNKLLKEFPQ